MVVHTQRGGRLGTSVVVACPDQDGQSQGCQLLGHVIADPSVRAGHSAIVPDGADRVLIPAPHYVCADAQGFASTHTSDRRDQSGDQGAQCTCCEDRPVEAIDEPGCHGDHEAKHGHAERVADLPSVLIIAAAIPE